MPESEETATTRPRRRTTKRAAPPSAPPAVETEPLVVVRRSAIQGRGAYATRDIAKDERIIEYLGKRMSHDAVGDRDDDESARRHHTFLFSLDDEWCVDGAKNGNEARFINHSCDPNAYAEIEKGRIFIHAKRFIPAGEEVAYDYWYTTDPEYTLEDLKRLYPCRCGAAKCRGTLAAPPKKKRAKPSTRKARRNGSR